MNKVSSRKSVLRSKSRKDKKAQKRDYEKHSSLTKSKKMKRIRQKSRKSSRQLQEYAEYESSRMDLGRPHQQIQRIPSDNSVIYVNSYPPRENISIIDLTKSTHSILYSTISSRFPSSTSLKLIYKSNNFNSRVQKRLTSSLLTIPMRRNMEKIRNAISTSNFTKCSREKLAVLDIPQEYLDEDNSEYAFFDLSKADLNEEDRSMIECLAMKEEDHEASYNLESKQPIENICRFYGVTGEDGFD